MIDKETREILQKQHYKVVGNHSAVKVCHWLRKSIRDEGFCYKEKFYGIKSHRCLQMTPSVVWCTQKCVFCWRNIEKTAGIRLEEFDEPGDIIDAAVEAQRKLISGFGGIPERINRKKFKEAQDPNQAAISLAGEPTIYPKISELIGEFNRRKFTTFLVTNGTLPNRIEAMDNLPTNLYVSVDAPNEEIYRKTCNPIIPDGWERFNRTLDLFPSIDTTKVVRITLVKDFNLVEPVLYSPLLDRAEPDFIEVKSYMHVGSSIERLPEDSMPTFQEIEEFSRILAEDISYGIKNWKEDSRVVLLAKK